MKLLLRKNMKKINETLQMFKAFFLYPEQLKRFNELNEKLHSTFKTIQFPNHEPSNSRNPKNPRLNFPYLVTIIFARY
jgi:hypothetical protein